MSRKPLRASGLGGQVSHQAEPEVTELAPRQAVIFWCASGHATRRIYALGGDVVPPASETCRSCWQPAVRDPEGPPPSATGSTFQPFKTHLQYAQSRRSLADIEVLLTEALASLHVFALAT